MCHHQARINKKKISSIEIIFQDTWLPSFLLIRSWWYLLCVEAVFWIKIIFIVQRKRAQQIYFGS
jgi:hypothetical protein